MAAWNRQTQDLLSVALQWSLDPTRLTVGQVVQNQIPRTYVQHRWHSPQMTSPAVKYTTWLSQLVKEVGALISQQSAQTTLHRARYCFKIMIKYDLSEVSDDSWLRWKQINLRSDDKTQSEDIMLKLNKFVSTEQCWSVCAHLNGSPLLKFSLLAVFLRIEKPSRRKTAGILALMQRNNIHFSAEQKLARHFNWKHHSCD
jgi:hypothetical protein